MRTIVINLIVFSMVISCQTSVNKEDVKKEIFQTEKAFEKMTGEKSIAEAFYFFADDSGVINRGNDSLIFGKEGIRHYYQSRNLKNATVSWTPDFIEVSGCGTLAYTYGKYVWKVIKDTRDTVVAKGVFHTVWKKQKDGSWKYVWD
jgi:ketosteroid isomerase-like protein